MNKNDGGPAFPLKEPLTCDYHGMSLRDYFAAKAMQGLIVNSVWGRFASSEIARDAYKIADVMLKAREEGK